MTDVIAGMDKPQVAVGMIILVIVWLIAVLSRMWNKNDKK